MTGPEHYRVAEQEIKRANETPIDNGQAGYHLAAAQVHATLALTAATVEVAEWLRLTYGGDVEYAMPWLQVIRP